jgi:hypothetical protein
LDKPSGGALSNPSTSELARDSENTSRARFAIGPAEALRADQIELGSAGRNQLADSEGFSEDQAHAASKKQRDEKPVNFVNSVKNCFGFRLRAYEAWRDLEKFFPTEEDGLKNELQGIWKRNSCSGFRFQVSGFLLRKVGGLKLRLLGYREHASFRCGKFSAFIAERCVAVNQK